MVSRKHNNKITRLIEDAPNDDGQFSTSDDNLLERKIEQALRGDTSEPEIFETKKPKRPRVSERRRRRQSKPVSRNVCADCGFINKVRMKQCAACGSFAANFVDPTPPKNEKKNKSVGGTRLRQEVLKEDRGDEEPWRLCNHRGHIEEMGFFEMVRDRDASGLGHYVCRKCGMVGPDPREFPSVWKKVDLDQSESYEKRSCLHKYNNGRSAWKPLWFSSWDHRCELCGTKSRFVVTDSGGDEDKPGSGWVKGYVEYDND